MQDNIVPDVKEISEAFEGANFGKAPNIHILKFSLLKIASGYSTGYTIKIIMIEMGLVTKGARNLTKLGKRCLWEWFSCGYNDY